MQWGRTITMSHKEKPRMNRESSIPTLSELTPTLSCYGPTEKVTFGIGGETEMVGLMKSTDVAVAFAIVEDGTNFPRHVHRFEREWLIITYGVLTYTDADGERDLQAGDYVCVEPGKPHSVKAKEGDVGVVAVTIPPSEEFPNGP